MAKDIIQALGASRRGRDQLIAATQLVSAQRELMVALAKLGTRERERLYSLAADGPAPGAAEVTRVLDGQERRVAQLRRRGWLPRGLGWSFTVYAGALNGMAQFHESEALNDVAGAAYFIGFAHALMPSHVLSDLQAARFREAVDLGRRVEKAKGSLGTVSRGSDAENPIPRPISDERLVDLVAAQYDRARLAYADDGAGLLDELDAFVASGRLNAEVTDVVVARQLEKSAVATAMRKVAPLVRQSESDAADAALCTNVEDLRQLHRLFDATNRITGARLAGLAIGLAAFGIVELASSPFRVIPAAGNLAVLVGGWARDCNLADSFRGELDLVREHSRSRVEAEAVLRYAVTKASPTLRRVGDYRAHLTADALVDSVTPTRPMASQSLRL